MEDARTLPRSLRAGAHVLTLEPRLVRVEASENGVRDVVPAISASRIATRQKKQRRRVLYDDASYVDRLGDHASPASLFDLKAKGQKARYLRRKPRGVVFAPAALGKAQRRLALFPVMHIHFALL